MQSARQARQVPLVTQAPLVQRAPRDLKALAEKQDQPGQAAPLAKQAPLDQQVHPVQQAQQAPLATPAPLVRKVNPAQQARLALRARQDRHPPTRPFRT